MKGRFFSVILFGLVLPVALMAWLSRQSRPAEQLPKEKEQESIRVLKDGFELDMPLEEYLTGVVLGEMPADFEPEALKAQAVVANTYAQKRMLSGKHGGAVCTDPACCQGYCAPEVYLAGGGKEKAVEWVRQAVGEAGSLVLTYEGELIDATYFSSSGGTTEAAVEVWGSDVPYLQSVASPENSEDSAAEASFTPSQLAEKLELKTEADPAEWFGTVTYTAGGGVDTVEICGRTFTGKQLRSLLGLRSTVFTVEAGEKIVFHTVGYGHRVGMSQYGAQAMALAGSDYTAILAHYYPGTQLQNAAP